jgi:hypothetical protein
MLRRTRALYKRMWQVVLLILITCFVVVTAPTVRTVEGLKLLYI